MEEKFESIQTPKSAFDFQVIYQKLNFNKSKEIYRILVKFFAKDSLRNYKKYKTLKKQRKYWKFVKTKSKWIEKETLTSCTESRI